MKKEYYESLFETILDIGRELVASGAEINRTDETLRRLGRAYGAEDVNVFVIYNSLSATMKFEGEMYTQTRSLKIPTSTDFRKIAHLNALSRRCTKEKLSPEALKAELEKIKAIKKSSLRVFPGGAVAAGAFAMFFGGTPADALVAAIFGLLIMFLQENLTKICPNNMLYTFVAALTSGLGILAVSLLLPGLMADKIIIGVIMLLVPGKGITNAARDVLLGDTISGAMKLVESLFLAGAMAAGYLLALNIF